MRRFYAPEVSLESSEVLLEGDEAHHAIRVLRLSRGDNLVVLNGKGGEFICECVDHNKKTLKARILEKRFKEKPSCETILIIAIPKCRLIEDIIEKAVELGVSRIIPIATKRTIPSFDVREIEKRRLRWEQIAISTIKQCGQVFLPKIENLTHLSVLLSEKRSFEINLLCALTGQRKHPRVYFEEFRQRFGRCPKSVAVWIGPEGDFDDEEIGQITTSGAQPITLGDLVLRVETAAIYVLSVLNHEILWMEDLNRTNKLNQ